MATSSQRILLQRWTTQICYTQWTNQICYTQVRAAHKFKTKNPRARVMERRVFEEISKPLYETAFVVKDSCLDLKRRGVTDVEVNPYEQFLIRQLKKKVEASQTILICHQLPCSNLRLQAIRVAFKKKGLTLSVISKTHFRAVIANSQLENLAPLLQSRNTMISSPEVVTKDTVETLKKIPELVLLGGFLGDRLVAKDQLQDISKLPPMEHLLGQFCASLNQVRGAGTLTLLNSHQQTLTSNLQQYQKQKDEESES